MPDPEPEGETGEDGITYPIPQPDPEAPNIIFGEAISQDVSAVVFTRQRWADSWTQDDTLTCVYVAWNAAPTIPAAQLHYRYGRVLERGASSETTRTKKTLGGYYVKIEVTCGDGVRRWYGFVDDTGDIQNGYVKRIDTSGESPVTLYEAHGIQTFSCVGIIEAFNRDRINTTYFHAITANETLSGKNTAIGLSAPFFNPTEETKNRSDDTKIVPNFTTAGSVVDRSTYVFHAYDIYSQVTLEGAKWSTRTIIEYLLGYATPRDYQNKEKIPLWLYINSDKPNPLPDYDQPSLDCDGLTLREALDKLLNEKKSLGYWVWVHEPTNRVYIEPYTLVEADYTVSDSTLRQNGRTITLATNNDPATQFTLQRNESSYANQIVIQGARRQVVVSLRIDTEVVKAWDNALTTDFQTIIAGIYDLALIDDLYQVRDLRSQGKWRAIDRNFKIHPTWNFKHPIVAGGTDDTFRIDQADYTKTFTTSNARYLPYPHRLRILDRLPLKEDVAYQTGSVLSDHKESRQAYRDLEAYGKKHGDGWNGSTLAGDWTCWSNKGRREILYSDTDPNYELSIAPYRADKDDTSIKKKNQELSWGIKIDVNGAFQGVLGSDTSIASGDAAPHIPRLPREQITLTLVLEEDRRIAEAYPATAPSTVDTVRRKVFDLGDRFQLIELVRDTIVGVDVSTNALLRRDARGFVRDDRDEMKRLAAQIARYYATSRNVLRGTSRRVTALLWPGQLVTTSNTTAGGAPSSGHEATVNCVVTDVSISFPVGNGGPVSPQFSFTTSRGELDPLAYIPELR